MNNYHVFFCVQRASGTSTSGIACLGFSVSPEEAIERGCDDDIIKFIGDLLVDKLSARDGDSIIYFIPELLR